MLPTVRLVETPSYRHRGVCIEGAVSLEHVLNVVEWLPRVGMNSYFVQFREAFTFFDRWYSHTGNPFVDGEPFDVERARDLTARIAAELKRRGLLLHGVGLGWTCEPLGMRGLGWEYPPDPVPDDARPYLAMMNGKRDLFGGVPLNTNLCYSNTEARRIVVDDVARYVVEHPEVDLLHLWLADGVNNHCECDECRTARPSDFYVRVLNEADARLTELGLPTRLVFLIYVDLLWPPLHERLANPGRFVLMFAPITRTYSTPYRLTGASSELADYERNRLAFPAGVDANVAYLRAWQALFDGGVDSFDYDYHLTWDHVNDPGTLQVSRTLHADLQELRALGLDGYVSCQVQRAGFPTGLAMTVMAARLWDRTVAFDDVAVDHFAAAFGPDGQAVRAYLERLGELFDPVALRGEKPTVDEQAADRLARVPSEVAGLRTVLERNANHEDPCWNASWRYLARHADLVVALAGALESRARGDLAAAEPKWQAISGRLWRLEPELQTVLDPSILTSVYLHRFQPYGVVG